MEPRATVSLTRFREPAWLLDDTLRALAAQEQVSLRVLVLDQQADEQVARRCEELSHDRVGFEHRVIPARGTSYAKNLALEASRTRYHLSTDPDVVPAPDWAAQLVATLERHGAALACSRVLPRWRGPPPALARAELVRICYSLLDLGEEDRPFAHVINSYGLDREQLGDDARFDELLGRQPGALMGGEESDLARRALARGLRVYYSGRALVEHQILPERLRTRWLLERLRAEGFTRAVMGTSPILTSRIDSWELAALAVLGPAYSLGLASGVAYRARRALRLSRATPTQWLSRLGGRRDS